MRRYLTTVGVALALGAGVSERVEAQRVDSLSPSVRELVSVAEPVVALTGVTVIDGTGAGPRRDQTIVIRNGRIAEVGPASRVKPPAGTRVMALGGHTVIPGLVGIHDHLFYTAAGGRAVQRGVTAPRLYLGSGVTAIRTSGGRSPYAGINTQAATGARRVRGPRVHRSARYPTRAAR